ncbi:hypothetical protein [Stenotrophomonas sp. 278]|uniref:hypothetical protein n=1 Tax=Stenotrophomonas sp. 278 TaxID=2479851 RepID=UPI000F692000|nr:hypothetical protein [Stenotrophomonas sp. 278]
MVIVAAINRIIGLSTVFAIIFAGNAVAKDKDAFYVEGAVSIVDGCLEVSTRELQFACHRIVPGEGLVIALREYARSRKVDGSTYKKVTVVLREWPVDSATVSIGSSDVKVFYSAGPAAFAGKRGCFGTATKGTVSVELEKGVASIKVNAEVPVRSPLDWKGDCDQPIVIDTAFSAHKRNLLELDAWHGNPREGDSPFEEANIMN